MAYTAKPKKARKYRDPHFWLQVTTRMFCALGEHDVFAGMWVRLRRGDIYRRASCEICLKNQFGIAHRPFTSSAPDDAVDNRQRRAGEV